NTSRDFCYIDNVVQANLLAATAPEYARNQIYNIAAGQKTTLDQLLLLLKKVLAENGIQDSSTIEHREFRPGDVRHSLADIQKAHRLLGYSPTHNVEEGLLLTVPWFIRKTA